ncbi:FAD-binding oxidoreductase [Mycoplana dimorpha]|uniref:FAD/FMN-containing dehydrogenase n=1 Tax=Mycoplana dimorpha TaxID=28320 RepID=A0A2T5AXH7_MYCDI|nr:FAD-binding oxidoreductase [Mycoplana dimorpha]PTM91407.1 FAD/FMN-containing dehydrogenase [Mycoplana dimorpha]
MAIIEDLKNALGADAVLTGAQIGERHRSDASLTGRVLPIAVLRPRSVEEVSAALRICHAHGQPVVPQGGMTGLAGGANARGGEVAISLEHLAGIEEIDAAAGTITVKAGTVLEVAQRAAEDAGLLLPVDLGARGSCQIGGNLSTNAGGVRVIRHGVTRDNVLGLEVVLADGTVLSMLNKMTKNNTGYDLRQFFIGAEGTLGIITRAVLKLKPLPAARNTALAALESYEAVVALLQKAQRDLVALSAFEAMWQAFVRFNTEASGIKLFDADHLFLVIIEEDGDGSDAARERFEAFLGDALEDGLIVDALVAQSEKEARNFWTVREAHDMDRLLPSLINLDVSLPIGEIGRFAETCEAALLERFPAAHVSFFGHIGDSNVHIAVSVGDASEQDLHAVDEIVYDLVQAHRGSISAEHGIGTLKRAHLGCSRSPEELETMRRIKQALDPKGILNPGKVL